MGRCQVVISAAGYKAVVGMNDGEKARVLDAILAMAAGIECEVSAVEEVAARMIVRRDRAVHPTAAEVEAWCRENGIGIDAQQFVDYYTANGWKVGRNPMKDWHAAARNWARRDRGEKRRLTDPEVSSLDMNGMDEEIMRYTPVFRSDKGE